MFCLLLSRVKSASRMYYVCRQIVYGLLCDEQGFSYLHKGTLMHIYTFIQDPRDWLRWPCVPRPFSLSFHHMVHQSREWMCWSFAANYLSSSQMSHIFAFVAVNVFVENLNYTSSSFSSSAKNHISMFAFVLNLSWSFASCNYKMKRNCQWCLSWCPHF